MSQTADTTDGIAFGVLRSEMLAQLPRLTAQDFAPHVPVAIEALGCIRPDCADWLTRFLAEAQPDGVDLAVHKVQRQKPQLNRAEKRRIGIRSDTPFSRPAFDMLTEKGRAAPLQALRATAMLASARQAAGMVQRRQREIGVTHYLWLAGDDGVVCPACAANNGRIFAWDAPPPGGHPGMRACCAERPCRCVAQAVLPPPQSPSPAQATAETDDLTPGPDHAVPRSRLALLATALALFGFAYLALRPLLIHWG